MRLDSEFIDESKGFFSIKELMYESRVREFSEKNRYSEADDVSEYLSLRREKILEWYSFGESKTLLELGGAFGALTGLFCKHCQSVTTVENKKAHCEIIKKRWGCKKLRVINENPALYTSEEQYDYIIIHEIWGYIKKLRKESDGYRNFLNEIKKMLKPDGHIIIIADNRLALKYFNGALDEYTKKLFVGLGKYKNYSYVETFSLSELKKMLNSVGLTFDNVYYVMSDWHFPIAVLTDENVNVRPITVTKVSGYSYFSFFDVNEMYSELQSNGCANVFADAFIIDAKVGATEKVSTYDFVVCSDAEYDNSNEYRFPYLDEVDILSHGYKKSVAINDHSQLKEERDIINSFIKEVYEHENA